MRTVAALVVLWAVVGSVSMGAMATGGGMGEVPSTAIDIHVVVDAVTDAAAVAANGALDKRLEDNEIALGTVDTPHVTLYLTNFADASLATVVAKAGEVAASFGACTGVLNATVVSGAYGMWTGPADACLQDMSDALVLALDSYVGYVPIPAWVESLPPKERAEKIALIHKYGSPNVFGQFAPHITLAWDNVTAPAVYEDAMAALGLNAHNTVYRATAIAVSRAGTHGTVPYAGLIASFPLPAH